MTKEYCWHLSKNSLNISNKKLRKIFPFVVEINNDPYLYCRDNFIDWVSNDIEEPWASWIDCDYRINTQYGFISEMDAVAAKLKWVK
jgi:hypothetical protein